MNAPLSDDEIDADIADLLTGLSPVGQSRVRLAYRRGLEIGQRRALIGVLQDLRGPLPAGHMDWLAGLSIDQLRSEVLELLRQPRPAE